MQKETEHRLQTAQQLLLKKRQLAQEPHNYITILITHQRQSLSSTLFGSKSTQPMPSMKLVANSSVTISEISCSVRKCFKIPQTESFQLFVQGKLVSDLSMTVGELRKRSGGEGGLEMAAVCLEMF